MYVPTLWCQTTYFEHWKAINTIDMFLTVHPGFLSVHTLTSANWDTVGHSSLWNERNQATTGQTSVESACVFHRQKDNPSVSDTEWWFCAEGYYIQDCSNLQVKVVRSECIISWCDILVINSSILSSEQSKVLLEHFFSEPFMFFSVQVLICQVTCYIAEDQLFQWTEKVGYIINQMNICSRFWCDIMHFNMSWQWIQFYLAGWLYSLVWCRFLTVCSTDNWTSLCCQTALWLNTRQQTICTVALLPSYVLFIAALTMESLSARHWSSPIYSRVFQLPVIDCACKNFSNAYIKTSFVTCPLRYFC